MSIWKARLDAANARSRLDPPLTYTYHPPATPDQLQAVEDRLGPLPPDLRSFLLAHDGVADMYDWPAVWGTQELQERNLALRSNADGRAAPLPYDHFLFFAGNGLGDFFGYCLRPLEPATLAAMERWSRASFAHVPATVAVGDIIVLWHEDLTLRTFATDLTDFIDGWFSGERRT